MSEWDWPAFLRDLDDWVQFVAVLILYRLEILILPLLTVFLLLSRGRLAWSWLRWPILLLLILYLVLFDMHLYSALAVSAIVVVIGWDFARDFWFRAFDTGQSFAKGRPSRIFQAWTAGRWRLTTAGYWLAFIGLAVALSLVAKARWEMVAIFCLTAVLLMALVLFLRWYQSAERLLEREIQREPRLSTYLDSRRKLLARNQQKTVPYLERNRMPGTKPRTIRKAVSPWLVRLIGFLHQRRRMPTVDSSFIIQALSKACDKAWEAWCEAAAEAARDPGDPNAASDNERNARLKYLALNEALAECHAFSEDDRILEDERPRWSIASELLAHAAELQHQYLCEMAPRGLDEGILNYELALLAHFADLTTGCLERELKPSSKLDDLSVKARWATYLEIDFGTAPDSADIASDDRERAVATLLARRYLFLVAVEESGQALPGNGRYPALQSAKSEADDSTLTARKLLQICAYDAAEILGQIAWRTTSMSGGAGLDDRQFWVDRLAKADLLLAAADAFDGEALDDAGLHRTAVCRVLTLWGRQVEGDLAALHRGSPVWLERLETAADFYSKGGSPQVSRLAALQERWRPGSGPGPANTIVTIA